VTVGSRLPRLLWSSGCAGFASTSYPAAASSSSSGCAPHPSCLGAQVALEPGLPQAVRSSAVPAMGRRVASLPASFGAAGAGVRELPRRSALPTAPLRASTGSPRLSHVPAFRRWRFGSPRAFHPFSAAVGRVLRVAPLPRSACRASRCFRRVAPVSAPSGGASDGVPGCPASRILRRCRCWSSRVAPPLRSSSLASRRFHRVAPAFTSSGAAEGRVFRLPRILLPSALPLLRPRIAPGPASAAGSMMNPRRARTLHPQLAPRMNLRVHSGLAHPCLSLNAASILFGRLTTGRTGHKSTPSKLLHASRRQAGTAFPIPYRVTSCLESRTGRSVHASVNLR
jgi:hypothetical protein